jgi:alpha-glucosidase (family GH31 glycosyl hydrolase)
MQQSGITLEIIHQPYGLEHPYEQLPSERAPRDPVAGELVTLGAITCPQSAFQSVWAEWKHEGDSAFTRSEAKWVNNNGEQDFWKMNLPAFEAGSRVTYRISGLAQEREWFSEAYSVYIPGWERVQKMADWQQLPNGMLLRCETTVRGVFAWIGIFIETAQRLRCDYEISEQNPYVDNSLVGEDSGANLVEDGEVMLEFELGEHRVIFNKAAGLLTLCHADGGVILKEERPAEFLLNEENKLTRFCQFFTSPEHEAFYGFGERFNALNQRGNTLDTLVYDQYSGRGKRTYIPMPLFVSSRPYGFLVSNTTNVQFDLAATSANTWSFQAPLGGKSRVSYHLFTARKPQQVVADLTAFTGPTLMPPVWSLGHWMSSNDWNSQKMVMDQLRLTQEHEIPSTVLVIEAWSDEANFYIWNDAEYELTPSDRPMRLNDYRFPAEGRWPDPKGMVDELHAAGLKLVLWQIPVIKIKIDPGTEHSIPQRDVDAAYAIDQGLIVTEEDGSPYHVRSFWFGQSLVPDFTNPQAADWWLSKRAYLVEEMGVDGFKTDGGEHLWGRGLRFSDGRLNDEVLNEFPKLYQQAYYRFVTQNGKREGVLFSRAGFVGAQSMPNHWAGDELSTWEAYRATIFAGLSAGISGIAFWGFDISGFGGDIPEVELYLRAAAVAAFSPIMQYHSDYNGRKEPSRDRTPWNMQARTGDGRVIPCYREFANLHMNLMPYIASEAKQSVNLHLPMMRALPIEFPEAVLCEEKQFQYLFGSSLLVSPVTEPGIQDWEVCLPEGNWLDFWNLQTVSGPATLTCEVSLDRIPVYVREGTIVPLNLTSSLEWPGAVGNCLDQYDHLTFLIAPAAAQFEYEWYDHVQKQTRSFAGRQTANDLVIDLPDMPVPFYLLVPGTRAAAVRLSEVLLPNEEISSVWQASSASSWHYDLKRGCMLIRIDPQARSQSVTIIY